MAENFWDKEELVAEVTKSDKGKLVIAKTEKSGKKYVSIREWYCTTNDPTWKPGRNGLSVPMDLASEIIEILTACKES